MNIKDHATRLAVLKALKDAITDAYEHARAEASQPLRSAKEELGITQLRVVLPAGEHVATLSLGEPKSRVHVDERAFLAWVLQEHPEEIVSVVRDSFRKALLARLVIRDGQVVDKVTGEIVDWASPSAPVGGSFSLRFTTDGRESIARTYRANALGSLLLEQLGAGQ